jgi:hypothetical protein
MVDRAALLLYFQQSLGIRFSERSTITAIAEPRLIGVERFNPLTRKLPYQPAVSALMRCVDQFVGRPRQ